MTFLGRKSCLATGLHGPRQVPAGRAVCQLRPTCTQRPVHARRTVVAASSADNLPGDIKDVMAEIRSDPALAPVLDSPRLQRALNEFRENPGRAMAKYADDRQVMAILTRLTALGLKDATGNSGFLSRMGTSAPDLAASVFSDGQLAARLAAPRVRAALAEIRANPEAAMAKYENDQEIMGVLDMLQKRLEAQNGVIDV